jgi:hypothetical protein
MFEVRVEPMPGNPFTVKGKSGLWRVAVYQIMEGHIITEQFVRYETQNLKFDKAKQKADKLERKLNRI